MSNIIIVNGIKILSSNPCISAFDRGLTLGHGLFETILINNGNARTIEYHWNRLITSSEIIGIKIPFNFNDLIKMIKELLNENNFQNKFVSLRITITDGISERGILSSSIDNKATFILSMSEIKVNHKKTMSASISTVVRNEKSPSFMVKNISYLDNIIAKREVFSKNFDEALLFNTQGNLAEGSISNVFVVKNNCILTPFVSDGALPGITRHLILNEILLDGFEIKEKQIDLEFLLNADEVFISNSIMGVIPIDQLDSKKFLSDFKCSKSIKNLLINHFGYIKNDH